MYNPINETEDVKEFGLDLMRLSADRDKQNEVLGALFRATVFGISGDEQKPA